MGLYVRYNLTPQLRVSLIQSYMRNLSALSKQRILLIVFTIISNSITSCGYKSTVKTEDSIKYYCTDLLWELYESEKSDYNFPTSISKEDSLWIKELQSIYALLVDSLSISEVCDPELMKDTESLNRLLYCDEYVIFNELVNNYEVAARIVTTSDTSNVVLIRLKDSISGNVIIHRQDCHFRPSIRFCVGSDQLDKDYYYLYRLYYKAIPTEDILASNDLIFKNASMVQSADTDSDGELELLISEFTCFREGDRYKVYEIEDGGLVEK